MKKPLLFFLLATAALLLFAPATSAQPILQPFDIYPWPIPQSHCLYLSPQEGWEIKLTGVPAPPAEPIILVEPGCNRDFTYCNDPTCLPIFAEFISWHYDMDSHTWIGVLITPEDIEGCVCLTYDGWTFQGDCYFPYDQADMGDLEDCNYGTQICNPSHGISGVAWLGDQVDGEFTPNSFDLDLWDDGVLFHDLPWTPCDVEAVTVTVTAGPNYLTFVNCEGSLWLNAWKDGNLDLDFCDELTCLDGNVVSEWIIQDAPVTPGTHTFTFVDPGITHIGPYDLKARFRLTSFPVGRYGHSLIDTQLCPNMPCGNFAHDFLGEVEDYALADQQLSVALLEFNAIPGDREVLLSWATATETGNDHFDVLRDGVYLATIPGAGYSATRSDYYWRDTGLTNGHRYTYTLQAIDLEGAIEEVGSLHATPRAAPLTTNYKLHQNYPNPFNAATTIRFETPSATNVTVTIHNMLGQQVEVLADRMFDAGTHELEWNAVGVPSGIYLYRMETSDFSAMRKLVMIK